jgi:thiamine biosynthesis lipoprotein
MNKSIYVFGTIVYIEFNHKNENDIIMNEIVEKLNYLDDEMSIYKEYSVVSSINKMAGKKYVEVTKDVMNVIEKSIEYSNITEGLLDITSKPVIEIIKSDKFDINVDINEINEKRKLIDYKKILVDKKNNFIMLKYEGMGIDLGSMVKGYATDILVDILDKYKVSNALIDLGGNIYVKGLKDDKYLWSVGIQDPFDLKYESLGVLKLRDKSIVTSGDYERKNHIISPKTGLPVNGEIASVTIISDKSIDCEGLSTACYIMELKKGLDLINSINGVEGIFVTVDKKVYCTNEIKDKFSLLDNEYKLM